MNSNGGVYDIFGFPAGALISVGEYFDYSGVVLQSLVDRRFYDAAAVCAVLVDVIVADILVHLPDRRTAKQLQKLPVGAVLRELAKSYSNEQERKVLARLGALNRLRIRVVHPGSEALVERISPDNCPEAFAQDFFAELEAVVAELGGYSNAQFGEDFEQFAKRRHPVADDDEA